METPGPVQGAIRISDSGVVYDEAGKSSTKYNNRAYHFQLVDKINRTICGEVTCGHQGRTRDDYTCISPVPDALRLQSVVRVLFAGIGPLVPELPPSLRPGVR
jgi:hypothetical protein